MNKKLIKKIIEDEASELPFDIDEKFNELRSKLDLKPSKPSVFSFKKVPFVIASFCISLATVGATLGVNRLVDDSFHNNGTSNEYIMIANEYLNDNAIEITKYPMCTYSIDDNYLFSIYKCKNSENYEFYFYQLYSSIDTTYGINVDICDYNNELITKVNGSENKKNLMGCLNDYESFNIDSEQIKVYFYLNDECIKNFSIFL